MGDKKRKERLVCPGADTERGVRFGHNCHWPWIFKAVERARRLLNEWVDGFDVKTSRLGRRKNGNVIGLSRGSSSAQHRRVGRTVRIRRQDRELEYRGRSQSHKGWFQTETSRLWTLADVRR